MRAGNAEVILATAVEDGPTRLVDPAGELAGKAGLANPGLPGDEHAAPPAGGRLLPGGGEHLKLGCPAGEGERIAGPEELGEGQPGDTGDVALPADLHRRHRLDEPFQLELPHRGELVASPSAGQQSHDVGGEDLPSLGGGAQPAGLDDGDAEAVVLV